jgi:hypothetical protein
LKIKPATQENEQPTEQGDVPRYDQYQAGVSQPAAEPGQYHDPAEYGEREDEAASSVTNQFAQDASHGSPYDANQEARTEHVFEESTDASSQENAETLSDEFETQTEEQGAESEDAQAEEYEHEHNSGYNSTKNKYEEESSPQPQETHNT